MERGAGVGRYRRSRFSVAGLSGLALRRFLEGEASERLVEVPCKASDLGVGMESGLCLRFLAGDGAVAEDVSP